MKINSSLILLFAIIFSLSVFMNPSVSADTWALLVGIDNYADPGISDLNFTTGDVIGFHDVLIDPEVCAVKEENVYLMTNAAEGDSLPTHTNVLFRLENLTKRVKPDDRFIFYFSGHSMLRDGEQYLLSINSDPRSLTTLAVTAIPLKRVQQLLRQIKAHQILIILDACRNDPELGKGDMDNIMLDSLARGVMVGPIRQSDSQTSCVATLYASSLGQRAYEWWDKSSGVFSHYLIKGLRGEAANDQKQVTLRGLADYIIAEVSKWSVENGKKQTPWLVSEGAADILLAVLPETAVKLPPSARLSIDSTPQGADIYIDEVLRGQTPAVINIDTDEEKPIDIAISHEGYITERKRITVSSGHESSWNVDLDIKPRGQSIWSLSETKRRMLYRSLIVPGLGQRYGGRNTSGTLFSTAALTGIIGAIVTHIQYDRSIDKYNDLVSQYRGADNVDDVLTARQSMIEAHDSAKQKFRIRQLAYIAAGGIWAANILHTLIVGPATSESSALQIHSSGWNIVPDVTPNSMMLSIFHNF